MGASCSGSNVKVNGAGLPPSITQSNSSKTPLWTRCDLHFQSKSIDGTTFQKYQLGGVISNERQVQTYVIKTIVKTLILWWKVMNILYYKLKTRKLPKWPIPNIQIPNPFRILFGLHSRSDQLYNAYCNTRSIRTLTCTAVIPVKSVFAEIDQYALRPPPRLTFPPLLHTSVCSFSPSTSMTQVWGEESRGPVSIPVVINVSWPDRRWCMFQALKIAAWVKCSSAALLPDTAEPSETWGPGVALRRVFRAHLIWQKI